MIKQVKSPEQVHRNQAITWYQSSLMIQIPANRRCRQNIFQKKTETIRQHQKCPLSSFLGHLFLEKVILFIYFWTARRSNKSILKEINPECSWEGLMLKLKLQYFGHLMQRADSLEKTLIWERLRAGGEGDDRGWDGWVASLTQRTWVWVSSRSWWWKGRPGMLQSMGSQRVGHNWATELNCAGSLPHELFSSCHKWGPLSSCGVQASTAGASLAAEHKL